jgi:DNA repair exonuclease SbcCD ATPase subunit
MDPLEALELPRRVDRLEDLMAELTHKVSRCTENIDRLSEELREFKQNSEQANEELRQRLEQGYAESRQANEELRQRLEQGYAESRQARAELGERLEQGYAESRQANEELRQRLEQGYAESRQARAELDQRLEQSRLNEEEDHRQFRRELGQLSKKMGTLAEDIVAPSIPRLLKEVVGCEEEPNLIGVRVRLHHKGRSIEYDVLALCGEYLLINETKTKLQKEDVETFVARLQEARLFLPEYANRRIVGALASFYTDTSLVIRGERLGLIMIGVGDGVMDVLNQAGFTPRTF